MARVPIPVLQAAAGGGTSQEGSIYTVPTGKYAIVKVNAAAAGSGGSAGVRVKGVAAATVSGFVEHPSVRHSGTIVLMAGDTIQAYAAGGLGGGGSVVASGFLYDA